MDAHRPQTWRKASSCCAGDSGRNIGSDKERSSHHRKYRSVVLLAAELPGNAASQGLVSHHGSNSFSGDSQRNPYRVGAFGGSGTDRLQTARFRLSGRFERRDSRNRRRGPPRELQRHRYGCRSSPAAAILQLKRYGWVQHSRGGALYDYVLGGENEVQAYRNMLTQFPDGPVAVV